MFFTGMKKLGAKYQQKSILMIPRKGTELPFLYYFEDNRIHKAESDTPQALEKLTDGYFSMVNVKKFDFDFKFSSANLDLSGFYPRRSGMACMVTIGKRQSLLGIKYSIANAHVEGVIL